VAWTAPPSLAPGYSWTCFCAFSELTRRASRTVCTASTAAEREFDDAEWEMMKGFVEA
jgi:hypothetical protein